MSWNQSGRRRWRPVGRRRGGKSPVGPRTAHRPTSRRCLRRSQDRLRRLLPGGMGRGRGFASRWRRSSCCGSPSGFYRVEPDEEGIVLRFGAYQPHHQPGPQLSPAGADRRGAHAQGHARQPHRDRLPRYRPNGQGRTEHARGIADADRRREHRRHQLHRVLWVIKDAQGLSLQHPRPRRHGEGRRPKAPCAR